MVEKPLVFTLHAEAKLAERAIARAWVERVTRAPDWVEREPHDDAADRRFGAVAEFSGRVLRVVCVETKTEIRIITATFDRNARRSR